MSRDQGKRKLVAILVADAQNYSRLMGEDEAGTVRLLKSHLQGMFEHVGKFDGRVVDSAGDCLLAEFASVVDAVHCALEIQQGLQSGRSATTKRWPTRGSAASWNRTTSTPFTSRGTC
jgi:adenylate cyclase